MDRALDLKPEVTQGCGFESDRKSTTAPRAQSAAHCSKCVHLDGLNAENTFHSSLYCIIVYVTNKAHPSLICIVLFFLLYSQPHFYIEIMKIYVPPQAGCWPLPGHPYENILAPPLSEPERELISSSLESSGLSRSFITWQMQSEPERELFIS